jgi:hypothetical protein
MVRNPDMQQPSKVNRVIVTLDVCPRNNNTPRSFSMIKKSQLLSVLQTRGLAYIRQILFVSKESRIGISWNPVQSSDLFLNVQPGKGNNGSVVSPTSLTPAYFLSIAYSTKPDPEAEEEDSKASAAAAGAGGGAGASVPTSPPKVATIETLVQKITERLKSNPLSLKETTNVALILKECNIQWYVQRLAIRNYSAVSEFFPKDKTPQTLDFWYITNKRSR